MSNSHDETLTSKIFDKNDCCDLSDQDFDLLQNDLVDDVLNSFDTSADSVFLHENHNNDKLLDQKNLCNVNCDLCSYPVGFEKEIFECNHVFHFDCLVNADNLVVDRTIEKSFSLSNLDEYFVERSFTHVACPICQMLTNAYNLL